jgi:hypothetical protein
MPPIEFWFITIGVIVLICLPQLIWPPRGGNPFEPL